MSDSKAELFCDEALKLLGTPYIWGGKGPWAGRAGKQVPMLEAAHTGFGLDCSGLVTYCAMRVGAKDLRDTWNSNRMWTVLPQPRDDEDHWLTFFGDTDRLIATHVAICLGNDFYIDASGGDSKTLTVEDSLAVKPKAIVRIYRGVRRSDFLGTRSLDALLEASP